MKNKTKKICKILIKLLVWFLWLLILSFILVSIYSFTYEKDKIAVDKYNFEQLEKAKTIIENDKYYNIIFRNIRQFNSIYNSDIKPIKNCYYLSKYNWDEKFIFWFKLESMIYKIIYFRENYVYPKYDLPIYNICTWGNRCDYDSTKARFIKTISNPCQD